MKLTIHGTPTDEEAAAIVAALATHLTRTHADSVPAYHDEWEWHASALLLAQGVAPQRMPSRPSWGRIERLRRAGRGCRGVVGS